jgi:transcription antitermination factor NusG
MDGKVTVCRYKCTVIDNKNKKVISTFIAKGISKCSDNDTLNIEQGRRLADSRAKYYAYKKAVEMYSQDEIDAIVKAINESVELVEFYNKMLYLKKSEIKHIKLLNSEIPE